MIFTKESSHWYTQGGEPAYDADLRQARKLHLLPSVSTVSHLVESPMLTNWKIENAIDSVMKLMRNPGESDESFKARAVIEMGSTGNVARDHGEKIHKLAELYIRNVPAAQYPEIDPAFQPVVTELMDWIDLTLEPGGKCEDSFSELVHGYGGRTDYSGITRDGLPILADFKTQNLKVKDGKIGRFNFYDEWAYQLGAYAFALGIPFDRCFSVVMSSNPEAPKFEVYQWANSEIQLGFDTFLSLLSTYRMIKKFPYERQTA